MSNERLTVGARKRVRYYRRLLESYFGKGSTQLTFWWEKPAVHHRAFTTVSGPYYMTFQDKADYSGPFDAEGVPLLDYHGAIGPQYNPIAIAQYGLARWNRFTDSQRSDDEIAFLRQADWLVDNLQPNSDGVPVWMHNFDWEYREGLIQPWYSGLAQGQGISCLVKAYLHTGKQTYLDAAEQAFIGMETDVSSGGVLFTDSHGDQWIEEYVVDPPSHILNGFIWALWGVYDLAKVSQRRDVAQLFESGVQTILRNLDKYDTGWWSTYDLGTRMKNPSSPFYHSLHIVQLEVMHRLTEQSAFRKVAKRWRGYQNHSLNRKRALIQKAIFKILYY